MANESIYIVILYFVLCCAVHVQIKLGDEGKQVCELSICAEDEISLKDLKLNKNGRLL